MALSALINELQQRLAEEGYADVRPVHGFVFQRVAVGNATAAQIAMHLGITRQATQQILDDLVIAGYLRRKPNPNDARTKWIEFTSKGSSCLKTVDSAYCEMDRRWRRELSSRKFHTLAAGLSAIAEAGNVKTPIRPVW